MAEYNVVFHSLDEAADILEQMNGKLEKDIETMQTTTNTLKGKWQSEAETAFEANFAQDKVAMDMFCAGIKTYIAALRSDNAQYQFAEKKNKATASSKC